MSVKWSENTAFPEATILDGSEFLVGLQGGDNTKFELGLIKSFVSEVKTVKVSLSSAQILSLATTPVTLIAAPGAGKIIRPIAFTFNLAYNSTTYTGGAMRIYYSSGGSFIVSNSSYTNGSSILYYASIATTVALTTGAINDSLIIDAASAITVGNSTLDVYISYNVITL